MLEYQLKANHYRLIRAAACPYAHRVTIARELLGLNQHISMGTVDSVHSPELGWQFNLDEKGVDPVLNVRDVKSLYLNADPDFTGPYTVPALVDVTTKKVIKNESLDLLRDFSTAFRPLHEAGAIDLYPKPLEAKIDQWNQDISANITNGIYKIGFAENQNDYEKASHDFFAFLDKVEVILSEKRYLLGNQLTESDLVLFTPLIRLDVAYAPMFSISEKSLREHYPNLTNYLRELYQMPAFKNTTDFGAIKAGYYTGTLGQRTYKREIVPVGPDMNWLEEPHHRNQI